jgi:hypothetical protein
MDVIERAKKVWLTGGNSSRESSRATASRPATNNHRQRRERGKTWKDGRIFNVAGGLALIAAGFAFVPTLGPSYMIIVIGLWMLAGEILAPCPLLRSYRDEAEGIGTVGSRATWVDSSRVARVLLVLAIALCVATLGYALIA